MNIDTTKLRGKRVAILAADGFEYVELTVPELALKTVGAVPEIVSLHGGKIRGVNVTEPSRTVRVDRTLDTARVEDYDALLVVGGLVGPDLLRQSERARAFVRGFDEVKKPIATICHGAWVLISAGIVRGRRLAAWPGIRDDVMNAGGIWRDDPLARDHNLVSSRGPQDLPVFVPAMIELFARGAEAPAEGALAKASHDVVSSPPRDEPPSAMIAAARLLPGPTMRTAATAALAVGVGALALRRALS